MSSKIKNLQSGEVKAVTPTEQIALSSAKETTGVDSRGRTIILRKPSTWQKFELPRILGADSINPGWQFQALMLLHVVRIDDDDDVFFTTIREMKGVVDKLGDEGMEEVERLYIEHFMPKGGANDELKK